MKKILILLWMAESAITFPATAGQWLTSFSDAADQAGAGHKLILMDFTGSDWCGWCMKLDDETFSRADFLQYAASNLVLLRVDFPRHISLSSEQKEANHALAKKYEVNGFPTVVIARPDGTLMWDQRGYVEGGPGIMIDAANQCRRAAGLTKWTPAPPAPPKPSPPVVAAPPPPAQPVKPAAVEP